MHYVILLSIIQNTLSPTLNSDSYFIRMDIFQVHRIRSCYRCSVFRICRNCTGLPVSRMFYNNAYPLIYVF